MNENYKNRTGSFKDRPSAPPSALDKIIEAAAAKFLEKIQQQVNPINNVREVDRRSAQVAAQDKSLLGARTDFSPNLGVAMPKGTMAFGGPDGAGVAPPKGTFAFGGPDGAGVAPPKGTFAPADYSPGNYSPTTDYSPTPINKDISTAAQKVIAPLKSLFQTPQSVQEQNAFNRVMGLRTSAEDPNFRGVNAQRARDAQGPGLTPEARATAGRYNLFADPAGEVKSGSIHNMNAPTGELKEPLKFLKMIGERAFRPGPEDTEASLLEMARADRAGGNTGTASASPPPGTITSPGAVGDKVKAGMPTDPPMRTTRTPTDQGEQVGTQKAGTTFNGSTAPATGNRYAEMIAAGPEAQSKFIKDANLIHMIRGTNQTWGNPKIQGDLGVKEFKSALEAAAGIDAPTALTQDAAAKERATELEKQKIANLKGRFQPVTKTNAITGQQETHMVDTLLNEDIGGDDEIQEVEAAADAWKASDQGEEAQAALKAAIRRFAKQRKYLQYLTSSAATSK